MPIPGVNKNRKREVLQGETPNASIEIAGCKFASRCPEASEQCFEKQPVLEEIEGTFCGLPEVREARSMRNKIDSYIKAKRSEMIEDILELIRIKSINGCAAENTEALNLFLQKAEAMGFKTMKTSTGDVGIVELGSGDQTLGILVHMDVVGIGDTDKWTYPPFEGRVAKGFLWGRGVVDDKGPAVMCLYALKAIKELEIPLNKRVWLIVGTSEEAEWTDIASFKKEFPVPDFGFSPDGDFPIYNSEKGYCDVQMRFMEPCIDILEKLDSGDSPNTIPSRAEVKIRNQENLVFHGFPVTARRRPLASTPSPKWRWSWAIGQSSTLSVSSTIFWQRIITAKN